MTKITANELEALRGIDNSQYGEVLTDATWSFSIARNCSLDLRSVAGVVASLSKKGLVSVCHDPEGNSVGMTEAGAELYFQTLAALGETPRKSRSWKHFAEEKTEAAKPIVIEEVVSLRSVILSHDEQAAMLADNTLMPLVLQKALRVTASRYGVIYESVPEALAVEFLERKYKVMAERAVTPHQGAEALRSVALSRDDYNAMTAEAPDLLSKLNAAAESKSWGLGGVIYEGVPDALARGVDWRRMVL